MCPIVWKNQSLFDRGLAPYHYTEEISATFISWLDDVHNNSGQI